MKQLMNTVKKQDMEKTRIAVLRLELDYELLTLFDAIQEKNEIQQNISKEKIAKIRNELILLKAL